MGKKKVEGKAGRGQKVCVCGEIIGARSMTCPHCQHEFKPKSKPAKKTATPTATQPSLFSDDEMPTQVRKAKQIAEQWAKRASLIEEMAELDAKKKGLKGQLDELEKELGV